MLKTSDLLHALRGIAEFGGVFPADCLPIKIDKKLYIMNTDPSDLPGKHWVAMFTGDKPEFFDSLGNPPSFYRKTFEQFLINAGPDYIYNCQRIQDFGSTTCGYYCIYYVLLKSMGYSINDIVTSFGKNLQSNDRIVESFYDKFVHEGC